MNIITLTCGMTCATVNRLWRGHGKHSVMDNQPMPNVDLASIRENARYNCRYQGISQGEDVYGSELGVNGSTSQMCRLVHMNSP